MKSIIIAAVTVVSFFLVPPQADAAPSKKIEQFYEEALQLQNAGNFRGAWYKLDEGIKKYPNDIALYLGRATASSGMGHFKAAANDCNTALSLAQNDEARGIAWYTFAFVCFGMGDFQNSTGCLIMAARCGHQLAINGLLETGTPY